MNLVREERIANLTRDESGGCSGCSLPAAPLPPMAHVHVPLPLVMELVALPMSGQLPVVPFALATVPLPADDVVELVVVLVCAEVNASEDRANMAAMGIIAVTASVFLFVLSLRLIFFSPLVRGPSADN